MVIRGMVFGWYQGWSALTIVLVLFAPGALRPRTRSIVSGISFWSTGAWPEDWLERRLRTFLSSGFTLASSRSGVVL